MKGFPSSKQVTQIKERYPSGTKICVEYMSDPYCPIPSGTEDVVDHVDEIGTLHCQFENGRYFGLIVGEDSFSVILQKTELSMNMMMK